MTRSLLLALALALALPTGTGCADDRQSFATRVSVQSQLIGGPKALGEVGDYLLENDKIRVIIHGPGPSRGTTIFGGAIIDADLQRPEGSDRRGRDQVGEITPAFVFQAFNPTKFEVTRDGSDGGPAVVTVEGVSGELLQQVALLNTGLLFAQNLEFRIEYSLEPGKSYVEVATTIINASGNNHRFPFLDPPELRDLGLDIPGLDTLQLSVPLGHMLIFGAENKVFAPGPTGFNLRFSIEDQYPVARGLPAFPGLVTEYVATRGSGVSYGMTVPTESWNYPSAFANLYDNQQVTDHSILLPFLFSAVIASYYANPPAVLAAGEEFTYRMFFIVGRGDVGSVSDVVYDIHDIETGSFGGRVIDQQTQQPVERAAVVVQDASGNYVSQFDTDGDGGFRGNLPVGDYSYRVVSRSRFPTNPATFSIRAGKLTSDTITLDPPGTISVQVRDDSGRRIPCKVTLVAQFDASRQGEDPRDFLYDLALGEAVRHTAFNPQSNEYIENAWYVADGLLTAQARPGTYDLVISRGLEYDLHKESITVDSGGLQTREVTLRRAFDTDGYVGSDLHVHSANSVDSSISLDDRVISIAGEGVDLAASTDHNYVTDYQPVIAGNNLQDWLESMIGLEVTTFEMGHFNGFPLRHDSASVRGGDVVWGGETPKAIFDQLRALGQNGPDETIIQVNHPRWDFLGYFNVFNIDQDSGDPTIRDGLRGVFAPFSEEFDLANFSYDFDAVEIINGKRLDLIRTYRAPDPLPPPPIVDPPPAPGDILRDNFGQPAFPGAVEDWFTMLNRGARWTAVGNSDSHRGLGHEPGYPRTFVWVGQGKDQPGRFDTKDFVAGMKSQRAFFTNGPVIDFEIDGQPIGSVVTDTDGTVEMTIRVQSADWVDIDTIRVWSNGAMVAEIAVPSGEDDDFTTTTSTVINADAWFVIEAVGDNSLFPVVPPLEFEPLSPAAVIGALSAGLDLSGLDPYGNLRPNRTFVVTPIAFTNPIWVDRDGNGMFDPSLPAIPANFQATPKIVEPADVRVLFEQIEEVH
jgi:hypothetical protein